MSIINKKLNFIRSLLWGRIFSLKTKILVSILFALLFFLIGSINAQDTYNDLLTNENEESVMQIDIKDILSAYKKDENLANSIYKGKVIEFTGIARNLREDFLSNMQMQFTKEDYSKNLKEKDNIHELTQENEYITNNNYQEKILEFIDIFKDFNEDFLNYMQMQYGTEDNSKSLKIQAYIHESMKKEFHMLEENEYATVECKVYGLMMYVIVYDCIIK